jgi:hypothetical protein
MTPEQLDIEWQELRRVGSLDAVMRFGNEGLILGLGTVLSRVAGDPREVSVEVSDPRLVTLLAAAHLQPAPPASLAHLRRAAQRWREHNDALACMHLALSGLDRLERPVVDARRLFFADRLLSGGFPADFVFRALGDIAKYSPDQPRVPVGSGRASGQWTTSGASPESSESSGVDRRPSSRSRDASKFKIELPSSFVCAPPKGPITPMSEAAKKLADAIEVTESISKWRELGPKGEALIMAAVQAHGWKLLGTQIAVRTSLGLRIEDVMVEIPPGANGNPTRIVGFIEVKVNGGRYSTLQQDKDALIWSEGGTLLRPVGKYKAGARVKLGTGLAVVTIPYEPQ